MKQYGAHEENLPPTRTENRSPEFKDRAARPFVYATGRQASHDLLVMNNRPDLARGADAAPVPDWDAGPRCRDRKGTRP
jgi:hypothetical protein